MERHNLKDRAGRAIGGRTPEYIKEVIETDLSFLEKEAEVVIEITPHGIEVRRNENPLLYILAVIGPGETCGLKFERVLLFEIGIGYGVPYHLLNSRRFSGSNGGRRFNVPTRHPLVTIEKETYAKVSPVLFETIQQITDERVAKRKTGARIWQVPSRWNFFTFQKGFMDGHSYFDILPSVRFSVSKCDELVLQDVYWLHFQNERTRKQLEGFANFISKALSKCNPVNRSFFKLKSAMWMENEFRARYEYAKFRRQYSKNLFVEMLKYLPGGHKHHHFPEIAELVMRVTGWDGSETTEKKLANAALPDPEKRLPKIRLRDISGLRPQDEKKDHVVFELASTSYYKK